MTELTADFLGTTARIEFSKLNWFSYESSNTDEITIEITAGDYADLRKVIILGALAVD